MFSVRSAKPEDEAKLLVLYRKVAKISAGIARSESEVSTEYVRCFMQNAALTGLHLVVDHPHGKQEIIADIHGYKPEPGVFAHVISELTIAVDPDFHGRGIGKLVFTHFLEFIMNHRTDILRVELVTQESNTKALSLYQKLGFIIEGRLEKRIRMYNNKIEADIPLAWFNKNFKYS